MCEYKQKSPMCGIFGYIGVKRAAPILLRGLERLEYRGYDSAGIAVLNGDRVRLYRALGKISVLKAKVPKSLRGTAGIAHTRWATHGEPSVANAHPHADCKGEIFLVHNGIIENYESLKKILKGHKFSSKTDSEVLVHLIEEFYRGDLTRAVAEALSKVQGTFGIAVLHKGERKIVAARNGSPLIIGIRKDGRFIASDPSAIAEHTKRFIALEDGMMAVLTDDGHQILNLKGRRLDVGEERITWDLERIEKQGYAHFMEKEIFEQPETVRNAFRGRIDPSKGVKFGGLNMETAEIRRVSRILLIACGTSWHAALVGKYLIEKLSRVPVEVDYASEFRYRDPVISKGDLVIVISQSGETADTLAALREARRRGSKVLGISNVVGSTIAREVDGGIYIHAGPEIGVASTKAFTGQVTCLFLLALRLGLERKTLSRSEFSRLAGELAGLPKKISEALGYADTIKALASEYAKNRNFIYLGRGMNFPVALEGALKLKEISYLHAEGYPAAEMKHGPIALIDEHMPVVFIACRNGAYEKVLSNMEEVRARKGRILAVTDDDAAAALADDAIRVPSIDALLSPVLNVIPLQLLAYYIAVERGCDVDQPRNLAKSVTVE